MIKSFSKLLLFCHLTATAQTDASHMTVHYFQASNTHYIFLNRDFSNKALKQKQSDISVLVSIRLQPAQHNWNAGWTAPPLICFQSLGCHITATLETKCISFTGFALSIYCRVCVTYNTRCIWKRCCIQLQNQINCPSACWVVASWGLKSRINKRTF